MCFFTIWISSFDKALFICPFLHWDVDFWRI
jgi:hypothetical protein